MSFTERDVTVMHAELKAVYRRVRKLIMVRKIIATHRLEKMNRLRLLLKQELMPPQLTSPQCDVPRQRSSAQSPPQRCFVPIVITAEETTVAGEMAG